MIVNRSASQDLPDASIAHLQAALFADADDRALFAAECPNSSLLRVGRVIGHDWRELFPEFEEVEIETQGAPDTFFFLGTHGEKDAYRVRRWSALAVPGTAGGHFVLVEAVGDPAAVRELIHRERMVALGQIATGVAHEVNNPLTTVSGWLQILLSETGENDKRRAPLQLMSSEASRIANIVRGLLNFGRRTPAEQQLVRVNRLLADVLTLVEYQFRNDNIEVKKGLESSLPLVLGDANQLKQVFLNIVVNAREAMPNGGRLTVETQAAADGAVEVRLSDTGCGMAPEVAEHVFEPFYTTKAAAGGSGIGLFLCRNIVKDHGGTLTVSTRPGEGTTFIVRIPAARPEETAGTGSLADVLGAGPDAAETRRTETAPPP